MLESNNPIIKHKAGLLNLAQQQSRSFRLDDLNHVTCP